MEATVNWNAYDTEEMVRGDKDYLWHHIKPHKVFESAEQMIVVEGKGLRVTDIRGKQYLDATSGGVWSVMVGHGRESIAKAIYDQLVTMGYYAGAFGNIPTIKFAAKLIELLPNLDKVYFSNSGSEANEKAFKIIRQLANIDPERKGKFKILFRDRDYHGTTIGALSATGQLQRKQDFGPFADGFAEFPHALCYRCPFDKSYPGCNIDCARSLEDVILKEGPDTIGGCIVEPITAGGGIIVPVAEYYPILQEICNKYGIYLIMDEVVCGFGRTGKFWGLEQFDVDPDIVTMAKGVASGYAAISCTVTTEAVFDDFKDDASDRLGYFRDISTFGGGVAGGRVQTPHIDQLAAEGAVFTQSYSGAGTCAPSRAMMMPSSSLPEMTFRSAASATPSPSSSVSSSASAQPSPSRSLVASGVHPVLPWGQLSSSSAMVSSSASG